MGVTISTLTKQDRVPTSAALTGTLATEACSGMQCFGGNGGQELHCSLYGNSVGSTRSQATDRMELSGGLGRLIWVEI